jgi:hypothetical protein
MSSPSSVLTRGLGAWGSTSLLLTRGLGDYAVDQSGSVIGIWSKVTYLEARNLTPELSAGTNRQNMEANNAHLESH